MSGIASSGRSAPAAPLTPSTPGAAAAPLSGARQASSLQGVSRVERDGRRRQPSAGPARDSLASRVFGDALRDLSATRNLRPAAVRRQLEALQNDLQRLQDEEPEDLFELALGALEDEIRNAERLQAVLQAAARR